MKNSTYPNFDPNSFSARHVNNVAAMGQPHAQVRANTSRSEAASIMGSATGGAKAKAAQANGKKGGRPEGS